jgi:hypothetical protein
MTEAVTQHREHIQNEYRRGRGKLQNSISLAERHATNTWHEKHHRPPNVRSQGDDLSRLFHCLLAAMKGHGFIDRMPDIPHVATDPKKFHSQYWKTFAKWCWPEWQYMNPSQKRRRLHEWIVEKFSMDPHGRCMLPGPGCPKRPRNDACWRKFEITDAEAETLVSDTMQAYWQDWVV